MFFFQIRTGLDDGPYIVVAAPPVALLVHPGSRQDSADDEDEALKTRLLVKHSAGRWKDRCSRGGNLV